MNSCLCKMAMLAAGIIAAAHLTSSYAVPFGSSAGGSVTIVSCSSATAVSIPITVDASSRIYATLVGNAANSGGTDNAFSYEIVLRDAGDTSDLAHTNGNYFPSINAGQFFSNSQLFFSDSQIMYSGAVGSGNSIFVATPGSYLLKAVLHASGGGCGTGVSAGGTLTYILLSSVPDRIYANGFAVRATKSDLVLASLAV